MSYMLNKPGHVFHLSLALSLNRLGWKDSKRVQLAWGFLRNKLFLLPCCQGISIVVSWGWPFSRKSMYCDLYWAVIYFIYSFDIKCLERLPSEDKATKFSKSQRGHLHSSFMKIPHMNKRNDLIDQLGLNGYISILSLLSPSLHPSLLSPSPMGRNNSIFKQTRH